MSGILSTSLSGLIAAQRSLETVNHNISNVNTEGYSRQQVELGTNLAKYTGSGYIGQGVNVTNVARSYDQFINKQLSSSLSAFGDVDRYHQLATGIDNIMADPNTGMAPVLDRFFNAMQEVANDPSSVSSRQALLSEAGILTQNFNTMGNRFEEIRTQNNNDIEGMVNDINSFASSIADLNLQILTKTQGARVPNDLLDKQDAILSNLAKIVNVSVIPQSNGTTNVFIGNGQALVLNSGTTKFTTIPSPLDPNQLGIAINTAGGAVDISSQISGGSLAGSLRFRDEVLDPAQQKLGRVAAGLAMDVNALHEKGFDLNGTAGTALFSFGADEVPVINNPLNTGAAVVTAKFQDVNANPAAAGNLDFSDYKLDYVNNAGVADYTLTRVRDNQVINLIANATANPGVYTLAFSPTQPANIDVKDVPGIDITVDQNAGINVGDQFEIRPTFNAAQKIAVNIDDPRKIAAATNIEFDPVTKQPVQQVVGGVPVVDALGNPVYVTIKGAMPGDNSNALKLANLANKASLLGGTATYNDTYGQVVSGVGTLTRAAELSSSAQEVLLNQSKEARESLAGVNLDEEAANLIKFQQAYQASAQAISVSKSLFETLVGAIR